ncbi:MAG: hypothetical protein KGQ36_05375 [Rickettsiales bacterium]|nr:hypothetical protein [Rickettsiales bacterium]
MPKFLLPTIFNNHRVETPEGFVKQSGLGSAFSFEFMAPQLMMAAQKAGYETYSVLYDTVKKDEEGKIKADLVEVKLNNAELMDQIAASEENLKEVIKAFEKALPRRKERMIEIKNGLAMRVEELEASSKRNEEQEKELQINKGLLSSYETWLSDEKSWKYGIRTFPISTYVLNQFAVIHKDSDMIECLDRIAAQKNPPIFWDKDKLFSERVRIPNVDLKEFLEVGCEGQNRNIFYIRDFKEGEKFNHISECFKELEQSGIKFPTSMKTMALHEKLVVKENEDLSKLTLPMDCFDISDAEAIANFYHQNCVSEGMVIKPYLTFGGNGILFLEKNISDEDLPKKIAEIIDKAKEIEESLKGRDESDGVIDFSKIIVQKKLCSLKNDKENNLHAGDVRFTAINGEFIGGVLRYVENDEEDKPLSYEECKNLLPNNKILNQDNIAEFVELARKEGNADKVDYYENIGRAFEVALKVTNWCKENGHFHVGFDVLIGRNIEGKWTNCLTELNLGWPDCIPEHRWNNTKCGESEDKIRICDRVLDIVGRGEYISPLKLERIRAGSGSPQGPELLGQLLANNQEPDYCLDK